jgi:hypothetical protein
MVVATMKDGMILSSVDFLVALEGLNTSSANSQGEEK